MPNLQPATDQISRQSAPSDGSPLPGKLTCVPWTALIAEREAWDALALRASEPNPFFESWYLLPSLEHLPGTDGVSILRFEQNGVLAGLLPVVRSPRYYRWPIPQLASWVHDNCFLGVPLVAQGAETAFWRAVLDWADRHAGTSLFLHLRGITMEGPIHAALLALVEEDGRQCAVVHSEDRAMLASDLGPEAYLEASLSGKKRKELRRQANRLADEGEVSFARSRTAEGIDEWSGAFVALEQAGWKGEAGSALGCNPATQAMFTQSLSAAAKQGRLERLTLLLDGRPIAMLASFVTPPGAFSYKTAFDEAYARFSPGVLLQRENLAMLEHDEIAWTDSCASADHPMIDHLWRERRTIGRLSIAIGGRVRRGVFRKLVQAEQARSSSPKATS